MCRFEILVVMEIYFDKFVFDLEVNIFGMKFIRLDRKGCKGGGCIFYYVEYLWVFYCKDLFISGIEVVWL